MKRYNSEIIALDDNSYNHHYFKYNLKTYSSFYNFKSIILQTLPPGKVPLKQNGTSIYFFNTPRSLHPLITKKISISKGTTFLLNCISNKEEFQTAIMFSGLKLTLNDIPDDLTVLYPVAFEHR